jgi:hypothetical protein
VAPHDRDVNGVPRGQALVAAQDPAGALDVDHLDRIDDIDDRKEDVEGRIDIARSMDRDEAMQDLLQDLCVGAQDLAVRDRVFEKAPGRGFVGMVRADQVHRDIRVDEDHGASVGAR